MADCECMCVGCDYFCEQDEPRGGTDAHETRILLALDRSLAAAARERGIAACDGYDRDMPCDIGDLHTRASTVAHALAVLLADATPRNAETAVEALESLASGMIAAFSLQKVDG